MLKVIINLQYNIKVLSRNNPQKAEQKHKHYNSIENNPKKK